MNLTEEQKELLFKKVADLKVQSMLFDMDIDYETLSLVPYSKDDLPEWLKRWRDKQSESDFETNFDVDWSDVND